MEGFLNAVQSVAVILLLTATGYFCGARGWMNAQSKAFISKFLMTLAVPCMCVSGLRGNLTREMLSESLRVLAVPFICSAAAFLLSFLVARLMKLPRRQLGVFLVMCSISNAMFIGYPMCTELFGDACIPYVMLYYFANTCFTQTLAMWLIRWSGESADAPRKSPLSFLASPTVIALFVGFTLVLLDVKLPSFLASYLRYTGSIVSPVALLLVGYIIYELGLDKLRLDRTMLVMLGFRFLLAPMSYVLCCSLLGVHGLARSTLLVEGSMPVVTQTVVAASQYGADEQLAAEGAALSTLASFLAIPLLMLYIQAT
ncbi:MAG: AEC family transporter [Ruminococcaceae bacterium]|nr:AEC family transporter [Oscillospiraceae bacterium]